jgi:GNAT superfamily N-acetyltransferase
MKHKIHIRKTGVEDIPKLARLMGDLGYPVSQEQMETRLNNIGSHPDYCTLVAFHTGLLYNTDGIHIRVIALVTDSNYRGIGAGKKLMLAVEDFAEQLGAAGIVLNSGNRTEREDAHHFYLSLGYQAKSTGFVKTLN